MLKILVNFFKPNPCTSHDWVKIIKDGDYMSLDEAMKIAPWANNQLNLYKENGFNQVKRFDNIYKCKCGAKQVNYFFDSPRCFISYDNRKKKDFIFNGNDEFPKELDN